MASVSSNSAEDVNEAPPTNTNPISDLLSLQNPTWEYLHNNFKKVELQKHCRDLGYTKIWVTKEKLVDMIMEKANVSSQQSRHQQVSDTLLKKMMDDIEQIKEKMNEKDIEIEEIGMKFKNAQRTIDQLQRRVATLEEERQVYRERQQQVRDGTTLPPLPLINASSLINEKTLILGDTNLSQILSKDLNDNCNIRTIKGANIDLLKCWVIEKLNWTPQKCILYCGLHDLLDDVDSSVLMDNLGTLISTLKEKNENMQIFLCELVPILGIDEIQSNINIFNRKLIEWCFENKLSIIKTDLPFKLGTGEIDEMCLEKNENMKGLFLNRYGVIRLLDTINKQYPELNIVKNMDDVKRGHQYLSLNSRFKNSGNNDRTKPLEFDKPFNRIPHYSNSMYHKTSNSRNVNRPNQISEGTTFKRNGPTRYDNQLPQHSYRHTSDIRNQSHRVGCYNCGEFNHQQDMCRYNYKLRCNNCGYYGHKSRLCSQDRE